MTRFGFWVIGVAVVLVMLIYAVRDVHIRRDECSRRRCASGRTPMMIDRGTVCACVEVPL